MITWGILKDWCCSTCTSSRVGSGSFLDCLLCGVPSSPPHGFLDWPPVLYRFFFNCPPCGGAPSSPLNVKQFILYPPAMHFAYEICSNSMKLVASLPIQHEINIKNQTQIFWEDSHAGECTKKLSVWATAPPTLRKIGNL